MPQRRDKSWQMRSSSTRLTALLWQTNLKVIHGPHKEDSRVANWFKNLSKPLRQASGPRLLLSQKTTGCTSRMSQAAGHEFILLPSQRLLHPYPSIFAYDTAAIRLSPNRDLPELGHQPRADPASAAWARRQHHRHRRTAHSSYPSEGCSVAAWRCQSTSRQSSRAAPPMECPPR